MLCYMCGASIVPNPSRMCINCLRMNIDVTEGISRQVILPMCKQCDRYLKPPWVRCEAESPQLMALCLKKVKGLDKGVKLTDASFIWTEEHSRRIKIKCTVQKEVLNGAILQQAFTVEFIVQSTQCDDCKRSFTPHSWTAMVQLRQRTDHKRTFLFLEQLILKHDAHEKVTNIVEKHDGLDFQFMARNDANKFVDFVRSHFPVKRSESKELISHDCKSNTAFHKFTLFVELCPVCKDDLVFLPQKIASIYGGIPNLMICYKVSTMVHLLDPFTLRAVEVSPDKYWKFPFTAVLTRKHLTDFVVLDVERVEIKSTPGTSERIALATAKKFQLVDVELARVTDFGKNDERVTARCHLGHLQVGDWCSGYDVRTVNLSGATDCATEIQQATQCDVIVVKKCYPNRSAGKHGRAWTLQQIPKENGVSQTTTGRGNQSAPALSLERDLEEFKRDLEEDRDMRSEVNLWKDPKFERNENDMEDDDEECAVQLSELLEGLSLEPA